MKLLFKQRFFSWFDSYDIYDEAGNTVFTVKGELSWGHRLKIFDTQKNELALLQEKVLSWLPRFEIHIGGKYMGCISKEFTFFKPRFKIDFNGWSVDGDWFEWDYAVKDSYGVEIATVSKQLLNLTDTYVININKSVNALEVLMLVLAIDAEKCSRN